VLVVVPEGKVGREEGLEVVGQKGMVDAYGFGTFVGGLDALCNVS
jgi:hypothetical protein